MEKLKILLFAAILFTLQNTNYGQKSAVETIVQNGTVVTMDAERRVIENGAIAVLKGEIVAVGTVAEINAKYSAKQTINTQGKAVIPGLINTHTHIPMTLFRGIGNDLDLQQWLEKYIFPAEAKNLSEDFVRVGTRLGLAEMIRGGTTTYCDMYYFEDAIADETFKAGVRGVLGETVIQFPTADNKTPQDAIAYTEKFVNKWKNNELIVPAYAPHSPYLLTTEQLLAVKKSADKLNAAVVIHVAETQTEVDTITKNYAARPVEYLNRIGFLNNRTIAAHTVHINNAEIDILQKNNVGSAHCPQSNMKLASGVAPVPAMLAANVRLGLGTDGAASNNDLDMWQEMDTAAKLHKLYAKDPKVVTAEQSFAMATIGGARALHLENKIGSLEQGKRADIVIVDLDAVHQTPLFDVYSQLVYATKASDVSSVIINGRFVMRDRRLLTLNENAIKKDANLYREKIIKSLSN